MAHEIYGFIIDDVVNDKARCRLIYTTIRKTFTGNTIKTLIPVKELPNLLSMWAKGCKTMGSEFIWVNESSYNFAP